MEREKSTAERNEEHNKSNNVYVAPRFVNSCDLFLAIRLHAFYATCTPLWARLVLPSSPFIAEHALFAESHSAMLKNYSFRVR